MNSLDEFGARRCHQEFIYCSSTHIIKPSGAWLMAIGIPMSDEGEMFGPGFGSPTPVTRNPGCLICHQPHWSARVPVTIAGDDLNAICPPYGSPESNITDLKRLETEAMRRAIPFLQEAGITEFAVDPDPFAGLHLSL